MDIETIREYCLKKPGTTEDFPFGDEVLVFRVGGKMYALVNLERDPLSINLKSDPAEALALRERYEEVTPGYHMSKKHWNTVELGGAVPSAELRAWIDASYGLVLGSLTKKVRDSLTP